MNYILKINSYYVCSREFNLSGSVSYSDIRDAALDEMVADLGSVDLRTQDPRWRQCVCRLPVWPVSF